MIAVTNRFVRPLRDGEKLVAPAAGTRSKSLAATLEQVDGSAGAGTQKSASRCHL